MRYLLVSFLFLAGVNTHAFDDHDLAEKNTRFQEAYSFIKTRDYLKATQILERNIRDFPGAPNIDYDYGWLTVCYAYLKKYDDLIRVYSVIKERFPGDVQDSTTKLVRNWDQRLQEAREIIRVSSDSRAVFAYKQILAIDAAIQERLLSDINETVRRAQEGDALSAKLLRENAPQIIEAIIQKKLMIEQGAAVPIPEISSEKRSNR